MKWKLGLYNRHSMSPGGILGILGYLMIFPYFGIKDPISELFLRPFKYHPGNLGFRV